MPAQASPISLVIAITTDPFFDTKLFSTIKSIAIIKSITKLETNIESELLMNKILSIRLTKPINII